jgi:hypothetical protein
MTTKTLQIYCECQGTGFIAQVDSVGEDTEYVECATHNDAYQDAPSVDELIAHLGKHTGVNL